MSTLRRSPVANAALYGRSLLVACLAWSGVLVAVPQAGAQENGVFVSIRDPQPEDGEQAQALDEIKRLIEASIEFELAPRFKIMPSEAEAAYRLELDVRGPMRQCIWQIYCQQNHADGNSPMKCWDKPLTVSYCSASALDDVTNIGCLGTHIDLLSGSPKRLPNNLCQPAERAAPAKFKVVYTRCFSINSEDEEWKSQVRVKTTKIPYMISQELDDEFRKHGYSIRAELCEREQTMPPQVDVEIIGMVEEIPEKGTLYVQFFVDEINTQIGPFAEVIEKIKGQTEEIPRRDYETLGDRIIGYLREKFAR